MTIADVRRVGNADADWEYSVIDSEVVGRILQAQDGGESGKRMLMVVMPWAPPQFPGLGPSLIRSILRRDGIPCDLLYGNLIYSSLVQSDPIVERQLAKVPICEATFSPFYFDTDREATASAIRDYILPLALVAEEHPLPRFSNIVDLAGECLDLIVGGVPWERYDIVGFSVMMQQTVPSLALAKRIRALHPDIQIVFGGANMSTPMGEELVRSFDDVDFVVEGEGDHVVTALVRSIRSGEPPDPTVGGVVWRDSDGALCRTGPSRPFRGLDTLPVPEYDPFFLHVEMLALEHIAPFLPFEASRGCWWGQKHHCTFCGIDDDVMTYRSKSSETVLAEIIHLAARYKLVDFFAVDSIINRDFHKTLLPTLGEMRHELGYDLSFFFETKSNISRDNALMFRHGGVSAVQPGIESFSDNILKLMNKGTTAARQVQCLRLLAENRIGASWNLIFQIPFETTEDYLETIDVLSFLHHLPPLHGEGLIPMQINRYAPYHAMPDIHGLPNVRPKEYYDTIFPEGSVNVSDIAFYFDCDRPDWRSAELDTLYKKLEDAINEWKRSFRPGSLTQRRGPGFTRIYDGRVGPDGDAPLRPRYVDLIGLDHEVFTACDTVRTLEEVCRNLGPTYGDGAVRAAIDRMIAARIVYRSRSDQLINLPLLADGEAISVRAAGSLAEADVDRSGQRDKAA